MVANGIPGETKCMFHWIEIEYNSEWTASNSSMANQLNVNCG